MARIIQRMIAELEQLTPDETRLLVEEALAMLSTERQIAAILAVFQEEDDRNELVAHLAELTELKPDDEGAE